MSHAARFYDSSVYQWMQPWTWSSLRHMVAALSQAIMRKSLRLVSILMAVGMLGLLLLSGCSTVDKDSTVGWGVEKLYTEAHEDLNTGNYQSAIKTFEKLESRYPFGPYAIQAQLESAYAYYKYGETEQAIAACDRFIKLHPTHARIDYIYYLKGLINFNEDLGFLSFFSGQDMSERDDKGVRDAFDALKTLTTRFPQSPYAEDALLRMRYLVNRMAAHETHVARYYFKRGAYVAAVNRAQQAAKDYPQTPAVEDALAIMVQAYDKMGMQDLRDDAKRVLLQNFPNTTASVDNSVGTESRWWQFWR